MHFDRDTSRLLNESIQSIMNPQYLSEEDFSNAYDQYVEFLSENFTAEELNNFSDEELLEGFMDRLGGFLGKTRKAVSTGIADFKKGYEEGKEGKRSWTGKKIEEPKAEAEPKAEPETKAEAEPKAETKPEPKKLSPEQIKKIELAKPEAIRKTTERKVRRETSPKDELTMSLVNRLKAKGYLTGSSKLDPEKAKAVSGKIETAKAKSEVAMSKGKEELLKKKRGKMYADCIERGGTEKGCKDSVIARTK